MFSVHVLAWKNTDVSSVLLDSSLKNLTSTTTNGFESIIVQASIKDKSRTHSSRELELERRALEEGGAVVIAASYKAVRTLLPYIYAVDYFGVASQIPDRGAAVPEEDGSKPKPRAELL